MTCHNCGKENIDERKYCFYCGADLSAQPVPPPPPVPTPEPPQPQPPQPPQPPAPAPSGSTGGSKAKKGIIIGITASVTVILIAVIVSLGAVFGWFRREAPTHEDYVPAETVEDVTEEQAEETSAYTVTYANVTDYTGLVDDDTLGIIQRSLEAASGVKGVTVKVAVDSVSSGDIQDYADKNCTAECGSNGILIAVSPDSRSFAVSGCGDGSGFLPENLKNLIYSDVNFSILSVTVDDILRLIPDSRDTAQLYTYDRVDGAEQVVYADSGKKKLVLIDWSGDEPEKLFETGTVYFGKDGLTDSPSESKSATPRGTFRLGMVLTAKDVDTGMSVEKIHSGAVWVDDPDSDYYNTLQYGIIKNPPYWSSAEDTYKLFSSGNRYAAILIEHNGDGYSKGERGKGSAMYLSGKTSDVSVSYGDVNITSDAMKKLLPLLEDSKNPHIVIK